MSSFSVVMIAATLFGVHESELPTENEIRVTIQRSIPYIEEKGVRWIETKKCVSCHRIGTMLWSLSAAHQKGFRVSDRLDEWLDWSLDTSLSRNDKGGIVGAGNKEGLAQLLLTRHLVESTDIRRESYARFAEIISRDQDQDGSWKPGGQLPSQKRSKLETTVVTTMWLAQALADHDTNDRSRDVVSRALNYVTSSEPGKSTEWYVARLLLAKQLDDQVTVDTIAEELRKQQRMDGGWGWIVGEQSDALGTGMSLFVLLRAGVDDEDTISRAKRFLIDSQQADGSWPVAGTKEKKRDRVEETATYWGTTWAVLALTESLQD
jgi:squalene-hopene/tetraprenyl-beta-curcumene cyclase